MDAYGRTQQRGSQPDPSQEWSGHGPETGLEDAVWQLELGVEGEFGYPERPDEPNCIYYLRTGFCGYGSRCRFNHPRDRAAVLRAARGSGGEFPERFGQPVCKYYMQTGTCKFGASCKYHHPKQGGTSSTALQLNYYGYPLRPGEKECTYYLKTGQCKFGNTCKFHHPQPSNAQAPMQPPVPVAAPGAPPFPPGVYPPMQSPSGPSSQQYGIVVARPPLLPSFVASPYGPVMISPGVYPSWTAYPSHPASAISPSNQLSSGSRTMYGVAQLSSSSPAFAAAYLSVPPSVGPSSGVQKENLFPERPGQPECQYYLKTGDCKYGSSCRYHHPPELIPVTTDILLNPMGLPLRPGAPPCTFYTQHGYCKFGAACMYDHVGGALSYSPSASSLADIPVAPYPVGSSMGTLAPSSLSFDMRAEHVSGTSVESSLTRMSSSTSVSSSLVGLFLSTTGTPPQASGLHLHDHLSAFSSTAAAVTTSTTTGGSSITETRPST